MKLLELCAFVRFLSSQIHISLFIHRTDCTKRGSNSNKDQREEEEDEKIADVQITPVHAYKAFSAL